MIDETTNRDIEKLGKIPIFLFLEGAQVVYLVLPSFTEFSPVKPIRP